MSRIGIAALLIGSAIGSARAADLHGGYQKTANGVVVTPAGGPSARIELSLHGGGIVHVVATPRQSTGTALTPSLMAPNPPAAGAFSVHEAKGHVELEAARTTADVDLVTGQVRFLDPAGHVLLAEAGAPAFRPASADGKPFISVSQQFNRGTDEALYGLGQHQNMQVDYNGEDVELAQHNMDIAVPFLVSTKGYGLLWDNDGITRFGNPKPYDLVGEGLKVSSHGQPGFTAQYFLDGKPVVTRQEATIDYQFIKDKAKWRKVAEARTIAATGGQNTAGNAAQQQTVVCTGDVTPSRIPIAYDERPGTVTLDPRETRVGWTVSPAVSCG